MTTTPKPKRDLKATDEHGRRLFCRDGHRIRWPELDHASPQTSSSVGMCRTGDRWTMARAGRGSPWRLMHAGQAGWEYAGVFRLDARSWYASKAHAPATERKLGFNCSHLHYAEHRFLSGPSVRERALPEVIAALQEPTAEPDTLRMAAAIEELQAAGWDFVTHDRLRCPDCIAEEAELAAELADLARQDQLARDAGERAADAAAAEAAYREMVDHPERTVDAQELLS